jgi:hypothetical protein
VCCEIDLHRRSRFVCFFGVSEIASNVWYQNLEIPGCSPLCDGGCLSRLQQLKSRSGPERGSVGVTGGERHWTWRICCDGESFLGASRRKRLQQDSEPVPLIVLSAPLFHALQPTCVVHVACCGVARACLCVPDCTAAILFV